MAAIWGFPGFTPVASRVASQKTFCESRFRPWRIMLEKVADSAFFAPKLAEPYKPYGGQFLEFCSISLSTYQTCMKPSRKSAEFCQFFCWHYPPRPNELTPDRIDRLKLRGCVVPELFAPLLKSEYNNPAKHRHHDQRLPPPSKVNIYLC